MDEDSSNLGDSVQISFDISNSQNYSHWAMDLGDGETYPSNVSIFNDNDVLSTSDITDIESTWESNATTTFNHTFTGITEDIQKTINLYLYNDQTSPLDSVKDTESVPLILNIYRDYTGLVTWTATPNAGDNEDSVNNVSGLEGLPVTLSVTISSGSINGDLGTRFEWDLYDSFNDLSTQTYNVNPFSSQEIHFKRQSNTTGSDPEIKTISLEINGSNHTNAPFSTTDQDISIYKDTRANFVGQFTTLSTSYTGESSRKGFIFIDYEGNDRNQVSFLDTSENVDTWSWDFGDTQTDTSQNPNHTFNAVGTYEITLFAENTQNPGGTDSDTEIKTDYIEISTVPVSSVPDNYTGITFELLNSGNALVCNSAILPSDSSLSPGDTVKVVTGSIIETSLQSDYVRKFLGDGNNGGTLELIHQDTTVDGQISSLDITSQVGTYGDLMLDEDIDASDSTSPDNNIIPEKFYRYIKCKIYVTSASEGYHTYKIKHISGTSPNDVTTYSDILELVVDPTTTLPSIGSGVDLFSLSITNNGTLRYASSMPYINIGAEITISGIKINNLTTKVYTELDPLIIDNRGTSTILGDQVTKSLSDLGLTPPLQLESDFNINPTVVSLSTTGKGFDGGLKISSQNHIGQGSFVDSNSLKNIMYWASTPTQQEDDLGAIVNTNGWGTIVTGRTVLKRMTGFSSNADTPSYNSSTNFYDNNVWDSQNTVLNDYDVVLIPYSGDDRFQWDNNDYTSYLPGLSNNLNRTTIPTTGIQYLTVGFCRQNINKFKMTISGSFDDFFVAAPTAGDGLHTLEQSAISTNGWLEGLTNYGAAGLPGDQIFTNNSLGVRDSNEPGETVGTNGGTYYITLGSATTANANSPYLVLLRFKLSQGQYISSITIEGY